MTKNYNASGNKGIGVYTAQNEAKPIYLEHKTAIFARPNI